MGKQTSTNEASQVLRALLLTLLFDARGCVSKLRGPRASVHDIRVAIRRLRTTLKAYRRYLGPWALSMEGSFGALAKKIDFLRDSEVQLLWLLKHRNELNFTQRAEADALARILRTDKATALRSMRRIWISNFKRVSARLAVHLETVVTIRQQPSFDVALRKLIKKRLVHFRAKAKRVAGTEKVSDMHSIRIKGKQLRYLIEPFAKYSASLRQTERALETLQSSLGDLHDIEILRSRCSEISRKAPNTQRFRNLDKILKAQERALRSKALNSLSRRKFSRTLKETVSSLRRPILSRSFHLSRMVTKGRPPVGASVGSRFLSR